MKVLIYYKENELHPVGGPTGYLYNLRNELIKEKINFIFFLSYNANSRREKAKKIFKKLPKSFQNIFYSLKRKPYMILNSSPKKSEINLGEFDFVHFHSTMQMYSCKDSLENYKGILLLTSHTPKAPFKEIIEDNISNSEYFSNKKMYDQLENVDLYAFNRADYIIFPTKEAEEPYYHTWNKYKEIHEKNKDKYIYIPTGIAPIDTSSFSKNAIRKEYNIPQDAFVVCYVGRHNEVKGYDQLKKIGENILKKRNDIYFLIAGKEEPLKGIDNSHWIEVGWTNKAHEIIYSSDVFVLPNKETYFDLILLEVMSIGKPVVLTNTGGNKYFKKFTKSGLHYYDYGKNDDAVEKILRLKDNNKIDEEGKLNKEIFNNNFTIEIFTKKYIETIEKIYKSKKRSEKCEK